MQVGDSSLFDIYVTGRDVANRSQLGRVRIDIRRPRELLMVSKEPVFPLGNLGTFDENGISYPCIVPNGNDLWLYYTGWMPTVLTPFQNHVGLARCLGDRRFERISQAPILERTDEEPLGTSSAYVLREGQKWRMWYTSFLAWGKGANEPKHRYLIKYAESKDGIHWKRSNQVCIGFEDPSEHSICRPSVFKRDGVYHMLYCVRGETYRLGYAVSADGVNWSRQDELLQFETSGEIWDSQSQCYPCVFQFRDEFFMLYCGNEYGREGLGIARWIGI